MTDAWKGRRLPWLLDNNPEELTWIIRDSDDRQLASFGCDREIAEWVVNQANDAWEDAMRGRSDKYKEEYY